MLLYTAIGGGGEASKEGFSILSLRRVRRPKADLYHGTEMGWERIDNVFFSYMGAKGVQLKASYSRSNLGTTTLSAAGAKPVLILTHTRIHFGSISTRRQSWPSLSVRAVRCHACLCVRTLPGKIGTGREISPVRILPLPPRLQGSFMGRCKSPCQLSHPHVWCGGGGGASRWRKEGKKWETV